MSLERKDLRFKLDPAMHSALCAIADLEGKDLGELVEDVVLQFVTRRIHDATVLAEAVARLGISGKNGDR